MPVPARRERADNAREATEVLAPLQALERLEYRQVGLGSGQPFLASATSNAYRLASFLQLADERVDKRGLANARLA